MFQNYKGVQRGLVQGAQGGLWVGTGGAASLLSPVLLMSA